MVEVREDYFLVHQEQVELLIQVVVLEEIITLVVFQLVVVQV